MANFTCTVNRCLRYYLTWRIGTYGSENTIPGTYTDIDHEMWSVETCDGNRKTATLGIVASSNSVIQCEELQYVKDSEKWTYSKFAMLIVEPQHEGMAHYMYMDNLIYSYT